MSGSPSQVSSSGSPQSVSSKPFDVFLKSCTAMDLVDHLLMDRFHGDKAQTLAFVRQCQSILEEEEKGKGPQRNIKQEPMEDEALSLHREPDQYLGEALLDEPVIVSAVSPRGKVSLQFYRGCLTATDVKTSTEVWRLSADQVAAVVVYPKPEDCKKAMTKKSSDMVLLHVRGEPLTVRNQKKPVSQVAFALPTVLPVWKSHRNDGIVQDPTVAWNLVLEQTFQRRTSSADEDDMNDEKKKGTSEASSSSTSPLLLRIKHPEVAAPSAFTSYQEDRVSTTTGAMPFVSCYYGTKDGVLFPLNDGSLLFHKPPFFIPAKDVQGITTGGRGGGNSRYVDLVVQCRKDETIEFTNVNRDEVEGLTRFLSLANSSTGNHDNDSEEDAVPIEESNEEEETAGTRKRSKRKASAEARRINKRIVVSTPAVDEDSEDEDMEYIAGTAHDDDNDNDNDDGDSEEDDSDHDEEMGSENNDDDDDDEEEAEAGAVHEQDDATEDETESEG